MVDPIARRWLARAIGVRYFVFGSCIETTSFDVNTYMVDTELGTLQGTARINVQNWYELKLRLPELAAFNLSSITDLLGADTEARLGEIIGSRQELVEDALKALSLQYPGYAESIRDRQLGRAAIRFESAEYTRRLREGVIGREVFGDLQPDPLVGAGDERDGFVLHVSLLVHKAGAEL